MRFRGLTELRQKYGINLWPMVMGSFIGSFIGQSLSRHPNVWVFFATWFGAMILISAMVLGIVNFAKRNDP